MIVIEILWTMLMLTGTGFLFLLAWHRIRDFAADCRIRRKGAACPGICTGLIQRGKEKVIYLQVIWTEGNQEYQDEFQALSRPENFPYPIIVYHWKEKTCLGIYSLIYDGFWFLIFFFAGMVSLLSVMENLWKYLNL